MQENNKSLKLRYKKLSWLFLLSLCFYCYSYFLYKTNSSILEEDLATDNFMSDEDFAPFEKYLETCDMNKTDCYAQIAIKFNIFSVCEEYNNKERLFAPGWVPGCYTEIAMTQKDKSVCDLIKEEEFPRSRERCYTSVNQGYLAPLIMP